MQAAKPKYETMRCFEVIENMNQNKENLFVLVKNKTLKGYAVINLAILYIARVKSLLLLHSKGNSSKKRPKQLKFFIAKAQYIPAFLHACIREHRPRK